MSWNLYPDSSINGGNNHNGKKRKIPILGKINMHSPRTEFREGNGNTLQYSCLENPMGGGAWKAAVHGVVKSQT